MFYLFILFYICLVSCSGILNKYDTESIDNQKELTYGSIVYDYDNVTILEKRLKNNQKASVGVLLCYTSDKQESFILLGRERIGKCDGATWCELGGNLETGESFLEAAIRESKEESGGVYKLKTNDLLNSKVMSYNEYKQKDGRIREELYVLLKVDEYYTPDVLYRSVSEQNKDAYREKDEFRWIACNSLCMVKNNPCVLKDIDGNESTFTLRTFFYEALKRDSFRMKLKSIM